ncbi:uncharacterized protein EI90DRAFT_3085309 [Cantharellus anzutake]|uniref:uncharacterized protein n=1 Tax=Cantharellus anzutake TaxID=1750568 RepID=UPI0019070ACF|nr:uncharacterized protein EI90DRAFT_3085309 [Cantharellus anzutake]KAF8317300.1 hypothetical protein EI90DRAFT_3085309 [Cantharellus anzutake]
MIPGTERIWSDAQITLKNIRTNIHAGKQTRPTRKEEWVEDHSTRARSTIWGRTTSQGKPIYNESPSYIIGFQRGRRRKCTNTRSLTYSPNIINQIPAFYLARGANSHAREVSAAAGHIRMTADASWLPTRRGGTEGKRKHIKSIHDDHCPRTRECRGRRKQL